jgi:hypothetical protein
MKGMRGKEHIALGCMGFVRAMILFVELDQAFHWLILIKCVQDP